MKTFILFLFVILNFVCSQAQDTNRFTSPEAEAEIKRVGGRPPNVSDEEIYQMNLKRYEAQIKQTAMPRPSWFTPKEIEAAHEAGMSYQFWLKWAFETKRLMEEQQNNQQVEEAKKNLLDSSHTQLTEKQADAMHQAAYTLITLKDNETFSRLTEIVQTETYPVWPTRILVAQYLLQINDTKVALPFLVKLLHEDKNDYAAMALGQSLNPVAIPYLLEALDKHLGDPEKEDFLRSIMVGLAGSDDPRAKRKLESLLNHPRWKDTTVVIGLLVRFEQDHAQEMGADLGGLHDVTNLNEKLQFIAQRVAEFEQRQKQKRNQSNSVSSQPPFPTNPVPIASTATNAVVPLVKKTPQFPTTMLLFIISCVVLLGGMIYWLIRR